MKGGGRRGATRIFALLLASEFIGQLVAFAVGAYLARTLGAEAFGAWAFASAVIIFLLSVVEGGTETWGMREISTAPHSLRGSVFSVLKLRTALAFVALLVLILAAIVSAPAYRWVLIGGAGSILALMVQTNWAHRALEHVSPIIATLMQRVLMLGLVLLFIREPDQVFSVTLWQGLSELAASLLLFALLASRLRIGQSSPTATDVRRAAVGAWPIGAARILRSAPIALCAFVLGTYFPSSVVGHFGAAQRLAVVTLVVSSAFVLATFPALSRACAAGGKYEARFIESQLRLLATIVAPIWLGGLVLAKPAITLVFSESYITSFTTLQILLSAFVFMGISDIVRRILYARSRGSTDIRIVLTATGVAAFSIIVSARLWGASGAAAAMLSGEMLLLVLSMRAVAFGQPLRMMLRASGYSLMAALVMSVCVFLAQPQPIGLSILIGMVVYVVFVGLDRARLLRDVRVLNEAAHVDDGPGSESIV